MDKKKAAGITIAFMEPSKLQKLLGEGYRTTALLLERGGEWDLVSMEEKGGMQ